LTIKVSPSYIAEIRAFGLAVRSRRERLGISQEALAAIAGLHRTYIGSVERGERNVTLKNVSSLARALRTTASQLLADSEKIQREVD
jgi:transcriptional regulator with XRE-family HTH domain